MVKEEDERTPLYFKKKVNSLEYMVDDFHNKITKCDTKHLIDRDRRQNNFYENRFY